MKTIKQIVLSIGAQDDINFLLTNYIPRQTLSRFMGWFSKLEVPLIRDVSIYMLALFTKLDLSEAKKESFASLHDCFIRELKEGARTVNRDPSILSCPSDGIVGACGVIEGTELLQIKGLRYTLDELLRDANLVETFRNGTYITLRLTAGMYHRFHAPQNCLVEQVNYIAGDAWNVNPAALKRVPKLFCKNERAVIQTRLMPSGSPITLVPVAAVMVASLRLHFIDILLHLKYKGPEKISCNRRFDKGEEMGWFQHGSTIIIFAPPGFRLAEQIEVGREVRMGEPLMHLPKS